MARGLLGLVIMWQQIWQPNHYRLPIRPGDHVRRIICDEDYKDPAWEWETAFGYDGGIIVFRRCPDCGRFIRRGRIVREYGENGLLEFEGWSCSSCGPITPEWARSA